MNKEKVLEVSLLSIGIFLAVLVIVLTSFYYSRLLHQPPYFTPASIKTEAAQVKSEVTFLAVGDIMLSRNVAAKMNQAKNPLLPFSQVEELLLNTDFNIGNLESPFSGKDTYPKTGSLVFNAPRWAVQGLREYNFKVLSLANNHALDQGIKSLNYTTDYLRQNKISPCGAGGNLAAAWQAPLVEVKGIKIAFVCASYASVNDGGRARNNYVARIDDLANLKKSIIQAKESADLVVVNMHAGTEYRHKPNQAQIKFAHAVIEYGADLVLGHHPHWVQTIEKYNGSPPHPACKKSSFDNPMVVKDGKKYQALDLGDGCGGKYIFYSLGNFIFDQMWSMETRQGLAIKFTVKKPASANGDSQVSLIKAELIPLMIDNYSTPRLADADEAKAILASIGNPSLPIFSPNN